MTIQIDIYIIKYTHYARKDRSDILVNFRIIRLVSLYSMQEVVKEFHVGEGNMHLYNYG